MNQLETRRDATRAMDGMDRRIAGMFGILLVGVLLAIFVAGTILTVRQAREQGRRDAVAIAHAVVAGVEGALNAGLFHAQKVVESLSGKDSGVLYIDVLYDDGTVFLRSDPNRKGTEAERARIVEVLAQIMQGEHGYGHEHGHEHGLFEYDGLIETVHIARQPYDYSPDSERPLLVRVGVETPRFMDVAMQRAVPLGLLVLVLFACSLPIAFLASRRLSQPIKEMAVDLGGLMQHTPLLVSFHDQRGQVLRASQRFREVFDFGEDEASLISKMYPAVCPRAGKEPPLSFDAEVQVSGEVRALEVISFPLIECTDGQPKLMCLIGRDVTEVKEARAERDRLSAAIECAEDQLVIADAEGRILYLNPAFLRATGYGRDEALGQTLRSLIRAPELAAERFAALSATVSRGETWRGRLKSGRKDGSDYLCEMVVSPLMAPDGAVLEYVAVGRDVSREVQLEQQLLQSQKMEAVGRLAGGIAHDFNNLLTVINGHAELLVTDPDLHPELVGEVKAMQLAGQRAASLTTQLLAFSRRQMLSLRAVRLDEVALGLIDMLERLIDERIDLRFDRPDTLWTTKADVGQLEQVLVNLVINARDAMPEGGRLTVRVFNQQWSSVPFGFPGGEVPVGEYVMLTVSDTGQGMAPEVLDQIFEPFFTTKTQGKGTGLGLSTVHGIITQSGGYVWVQSRLAVGTTFHIALPRVHEVVQTIPPGQQLERSGPLGDEHILLVEDEPAVRRTICKILTRSGYRVDEAGDGLEALVFLEASRAVGKRPDLVLSDLVMPRMGGAELAAAMKAEYSEVPVLFMSGYSTVAVDLREALGDAIIVHKPPTTAELRIEIRRALDRSS